MPVPGLAGITRVLEPHQAALGTPSRGGDVEVPVTVEIARDRLEPLGESRCDVVSSPLGPQPGLAEILVPRDPMRLGRVVGDGGGDARGQQHVEIAIAIEVDRVGMSRGDGFGVNQLRGPAVGDRVAGVGEPEHSIPGAGGPQQVGATVAVEVGEDHRPGLLGFASDLVSDPLGSPAGAADVFVPVKSLAEAPTRGGDVEIAIAIDVGEIDVIGSGQPPRFADAVPGPRLGQSLGTGVFEPPQVPFQVVDNHDVGAPIAIDVANRMAFHADRLLGCAGVALDVAQCELPPTGGGPVIPQQVEIAVGFGIGGGDVEVAVTVEVGDRAGVRVGVVRQQAPFFELQGAGADFGRGFPGGLDLSARVELSGEHLGVDPVAPVVGMIHTIPGLIPIELVFEELFPDRGEIGEGDTGAGQFAELFAVLGEEFGLEGGPVAISQHGGDKEELAVGEFGPDPLEDLADVGLVLIGGPARGVVHAEGDHHQVGAGGEDLVHRVEHPGSVGPADGGVDDRDGASEAFLQVQLQQFGIGGLEGGAASPARGVAPG